MKRQQSDVRQLQWGTNQIQADAHDHNREIQSAALQPQKHKNSDDQLQASRTWGSYEHSAVLSEEQKWNFMLICS